MRRLTIAALAALASAVPVATARADYVVDGRGWGHGVGMSQYGAYGYALREGRDFRWILGHYYTGTNVGRVAPARLRVLLRRTRTPKVCGASTRGTTAGRGARARVRVLRRRPRTRRVGGAPPRRAARGRRVRLRATRVYHFKAWQGAGVAVYDAATGHRRARVQAPVRVTG